MAVIREAESNSVAIKLNAGETASGGVKTVSINLSGLKSSTFSNEDVQKLMNIINLLIPILAYNLYKVTLTSRETIEEE